jgi:hypothetical protein
VSLGPPSAVVLAAALLCAACGSGSSTPAGAGTATPNGAEVRGAALTAFRCAAGPAGDRVAVPPGQVRLLRLCATSAPGQDRIVTVRPRDPAFAPLVTALARPDTPRDPDALCPMYADVPQRVLASTARGPLLVDIPHDGCGHYQRAAAAALAAARHSG